jgi:hypothetical protein
MMGELLKREREIEAIDTVGALRDALARFGVDDKTPICDGVGEPIMLTLYRDMETGLLSVEFE